MYVMFMYMDLPMYVYSISLKKFSASIFTSLSAINYLAGSHQVKTRNLFYCIYCGMSNQDKKFPGV